MPVPKRFASLSQLHFAISSDRHVCGVRHMMHKPIPSSMNNCTAVRCHVDAQQLLRITQHKTS